MKKKHFKLFLVLSAFSLLFILVLISPIFAINEVLISGNMSLSNEEVIKLSGVNEGENIFLFSTNKIEKSLLKNNYISSVKISKDFLKKTLIIDLKERFLSGYIEHVSGDFLYIDENGRILEIKKTMVKKLPLVVGLKYKEFSVGELLKTENEHAFETLITITQLLNKHKLDNEILKVSLKNLDDIHLYTDNIDIEFGSIDDADKKIRTISAILEKTEKNGPGGFLNIKDVKKPPVFRLLQ